MNESMRRQSDHTEDSISSFMSDDERSLWSIDASLDCNGSAYRKFCKMLENQFKCNLVAKHFQVIQQGNYCFTSTDQVIKVGVCVDSTGHYFEFSCNIHKIEIDKNCAKVNPYALMTTMMKYKTMLNQSADQEQLGRCGDNFIFLRRLDASMLPKENFVEFGKAIDDFIMKAQSMQEGFAVKSAMNTSTMLIREQQMSKRRLESTNG